MVVATSSDWNCLPELINQFFRPCDSVVFAQSQAKSDPLGVRSMFYLFFNTLNFLIDA